MITDSLAHARTHWLDWWIDGFSMIIRIHSPHFTIQKKGLETPNDVPPTCGARCGTGETFASGDRTASWMFDDLFHGGTTQRREKDVSYPFGIKDCFCCGKWEVCVCMYVYIYLSIYLSVCLSIYIVCKYIYIYIYIFTHIYYLYIYIYIYPLKVMKPHRRDLKHHQRLWVWHNEASCPLGSSGQSFAAKKKSMRHTCVLSHRWQPSAQVFPVSGAVYNRCLGDRCTMALFPPRVAPSSERHWLLFCVPWCYLVWASRLLPVVWRMWSQTALLYR